MLFLIFWGEERGRSAPGSHRDETLNVRGEESCVVEYPPAVTRSEHSIAG
jgi:hypothetical protein